MTAECHAGKEAEARVRPQAGERGSLEKDGGREFPGSSGADGMHPPTLVFSPVWVSDLRAGRGQMRVVWSHAVCGSLSQRPQERDTAPDPAPPAPPPSPQLLRLLLQPLPLGSGRTPRRLCSSKPPPHSSLHPVGT